MGADRGRRAVAAEQARPALRPPGARAARDLHGRADRRGQWAKRGHFANATIGGVGFQLIVCELRRLRRQGHNPRKITTMTWTKYKFKQEEIATFLERDDFPTAMREYLMT